MIVVVLIGAAIAVTLMLRVTKTVATWALFILVIFVVAATVFGVNIVADISELGEKLPKAQNTILLRESNTILTGFTGKLFDSDAVLAYLTKDTIAISQNYYAQENFEQLKGDSYKVMIIDSAAFQGTINIDDNQVPSQEIIASIRSLDTLNQAISASIDQQNLPDTPEVRNLLKKNLHQQFNVSTDADMRALLFVQLLSSSMENDRFFLIKEFKNDNVIVYPETITFKLAKMLPGSVLDSLAEKMVQNGTVR
jgi:hypothetical protein